MGPVQKDSRMIRKIKHVIQQIKNMVLKFIQKKNLERYSIPCTHKTNKENMDF